MRASISVSTLTIGVDSGKNLAQKLNSWMQSKDPIQPNRRKSHGEWKKEIVLVTTITEHIQLSSWVP